MPPLRQPYKFAGVGWGASTRTILCVHCKSYCPKDIMTTCETIDHDEVDMCEPCFEELFDE